LFVDGNSYFVLVEKLMSEFRVSFQFALQRQHSMQG